jgi:phage protein D/phage baseplate assembly protein gpV
MPEANPIASNIIIKIAGTEISAEIKEKLLEVTVDQNAFLPAMFTIKLRDEHHRMIDSGQHFDLTKEIEILGADESGKETKIFKGEITAIEPNFREGMVVDLVVRGYDKSHRLYRETKSEVHLNKKDSDLASSIAGNAGLSAEVDTTTTVYDAIYQDNQTDLAFLMKRAWRIGYECFVEDEKLYFRKPVSGSASVSLTYGEDLMEFFPVISLAEQVNEVQVKGWDWLKNKAILGKAASGTQYAQTGESKDGKSWAGSFGAGKKIIVDQPVIDQAEADNLAQARLNEISGAFETADGVAFRRPDIKAGAKVELKELGRRFSGTYTVTSATHIYTADGLITRFSVRGNRTGLLFEQMSHQSPLKKWGGVVPAVVTDTNDPDGVGRVKLKYPWMAEDVESWWARVVSPGAGKEAGFFLVPEVEDEVIVAFEHGEIDRPYVLGGVWSNKNKIPPSGAGAGSGEKPLVRTWTSIKGHEITMYDDAKKKIEIKTTGGHTIVLDDAGKKLEIMTSGGNSILCDDNSSTVKVKSSSGHEVTMATGSVTVKSGANMTIQASGNIDIKAGGMVNIKGAMVNIN